MLATSASSGRSATPSARISTPPVITVRMLLKSCATPPVSWPIGLHLLRLAQLPLGLLQSGDVAIDDHRAAEAAVGFSIGRPLAASCTIGSVPRLIPNSTLSKLSPLRALRAGHSCSGIGVTPSAWKR